MSMHNNLLKARFHLNMVRINRLVKLIFSDCDQVTPTEPFQSDGVRANIPRAIVVFLHATFEDVLRSHVPKPNKSLSFYSRTDIDTRIDCVGKKNWTFVDDPSDQKIEYVEVHVDDSWTFHCPEARVR